MKKFLIVVAAVLGLMAVNVQAKTELPPVTDHEKVKLYIFYGNGCSHCHEFMEYFLKNYDEEYEDYFEIVALETWENSENSAFAKEMSEYFEIPEDEYGVPFIIIGDYYKCGFATSLGQDLIDEALKQYQDESYRDVVEEMMQSTSHEVKTETLRQAAVTSGIAVDDNESSIPDGVFVAVIFIVLAAGLGGLVFLARK